MAKTTTADTAKYLALKKRIEALSLGDQLRLVAELLDKGENEAICETLASNVVDVLRARRMFPAERRKGA
ncbi:MAG: hypothetical protein IT181_13050 [Acidobacteria bacterium]|nr:hypothetical protein [Acidobacteriota bacterium]